MADLHSDSHSLPEIWRRRAIENAALSDYTTMRVGGPARYFLQVEDARTLKDLIRDLDAAKLRWRLIGGGSNLVIDDAGFNGVIVRFTSPAESIELDGEWVIACAGAPFSELATKSAAAGLTGLEFCAGIPGTVGGAIFGNAGAFGKQIGDVLESVLLLLPDRRVERVVAKDLAFAYRHSALKANGCIALEARFNLPHGLREDSEREIAEIMALRHAKHPNLETTPCAGSFFRNLEPTSAASRRQAAGRFLDEAGAKAMGIGGAGVFERHANIIVNNGSASCADVVALAKQMRAAVKARFGIELVREVQIWSDCDLSDLPG